LRGARVAGVAPQGELVKTAARTVRKEVTRFKAYQHQPRQG